MKVIAIVSAKGGVGKTTLTANLATALQREGVATLLVVDMDPQNALGLHFGADPRSLAGVSRASLAGEDWGSVCVQSPSGVHVLPYGVVNESDRVAFERHLDAHPNWLVQQLQGLELPEDAVVLVDTPPGPSVYMQQALSAAQVVVVVSLPDAASYAALALMQRLVHTYCTPRPDFSETLYVLNQVDGARQLSKDITRVMQDNLGERLVGVVHEDQAVREALAYDQSVLEYDPQGQAADDLCKCARVLAQRLRLPLAGAAQ
ncbi:cellulose biosynthesis protein BcsQ [Acidovorax sp. Leaf73]|uniref:cellulose biosynthesis protein BcsQ n=1 Tax=Acidovorax sp. Leaf73 TaxID=2876566 RepID=UPI001E332BAC|nr:cellulose biosynthesis protein BcsQ [Acidovorax sp. Leaf73]